MAETRQITRFLAIALGLAVLGLVLPQLVSGVFTEEAYVSEYVATLSPNGTLVEDFTYRIDAGGKRFLYRNWEAPLMVSSVDYAHIELVSVSNPSGTVAYIKDNKGIVHMLNGAEPYTSEYYTIESLAFDNEAGAFNPDYYQPGTYRVV